MPRISSSARALSSAGERCLHTAEVTGSKPVAPTLKVLVRGSEAGSGSARAPAGNGLGNGFGVPCLVCKATSSGAGTPGESTSTWGLMRAPASQITGSGAVRDGDLLVVLCASMIRRYGALRI